MVCFVLLHHRYVVCTISDHIEVSYTFWSSPANRLSHAQSVRGDREEPPDRLLPAFYEFRPCCSRDRQFDLSCIASWYDPPLFPLKQTPETNPNVESDRGSRPPLR